MKTLYLLSGKARSGKNTVADIISTHYKNKNKIVKTDLFANDLKHGAVEDFKNLKEYLNVQFQKIRSKLIYLKEASKNQVAMDLIKDIETIYYTDDNFYENKTPLTRILLQIYGTDIFRKRVKNTHWIEQVYNRSVNEEFDIEIITDVRFPNEISFFEDKGFNIIKIRIERNYDRILESDKHESEIGLDNYTEWDYIIHNHGTIEYLHQITKEILNRIDENMKNV